ncbi:hypothetical protein, partial [Marinobacter sp. SS5-14b]|uniref:hypothetical protein n=1 Tax=Marinobacter sp. SS5-14b TaxID=3050456 RepID=UPI0026DEBD61
AGNRQKSNKTEGDNAKIALEWLFFELKSDSAINQALIRPSLSTFRPAASTGRPSRAPLIIGVMHKSGSRTWK